MAEQQAPAVYVLAGVNGAGKSSIGGAAIREAGGEYYNPDEAARTLRVSNPRMSQTEANAAAWLAGRLMLERAIRERLDFSFETTLGANTMTDLLIGASKAGFAIHVWYVGLSNAEQHIARVRSRVRRGGHDISESDIRRRFQNSRLNLIRLLPHVASLRMFDNSYEADPALGKTPAPRLVIHLQQGAVAGAADMADTPDWAKPIVAAAFKASQGQR